MFVEEISSFPFPIFTSLTKKGLTHTDIFRAEEIKDSTLLFAWEVYPLKKMSSAEFTKEESSTLRKNIIQNNIDNERYLRAHPEVSDVLSHVLSEALVAQPDEPVTFIERILATSDLHALHRKIVSERER